MQGLLAVSRAIDNFTEFVGKVNYWLVPFVVMIGVYNVATRYIGRAIGQVLGSNVYIEAQWYVFGIICMFGVAYDLKHNEHVRVDVLYGNFSPRNKAWVNLLGTLLILIPFCALLIYFSWPAVSNSWKIFEASPDPDGLPRYPIKTLLIVMPILVIIQGISEAIKNAAYLTGALKFEEEHSEASAL